MKQSEHLEIWKSVPAAKRHALMRSCQHGGRGEIMSKVVGFFKKLFNDPKAREIAKTVVEKVILPMVMAKIGAGKTGCCGSGLKLPGAGLSLPGGARSVTKTKTVTRKTPRRTVTRTRTVKR